ncbi:hypothetical protein SS50377_25684 [Spironucleus salmonicida]|uniref:Uncharacterized protein n=1 Tax=Spironucleus salmonicida TaxID=348837 RepID=V6LPP6_9EUKA|nr:hypothetical protein SS50377_25684 [Spironucleus salmonicida]|eukprot:EST42714.1 hypothetical protein SS50377_17737 [Spironucleus salmonicida]
MPLTFTFEFPALLRTSSSTAPSFQLGNIIARNTLQRSRLSSDLQEMPLELGQAAEFLISGQQIPSHLQTKLYNLGPKQQNLTVQEALQQLSTPPRGSCSLVGITSDYENYKQIDIPSYLRILAEEQLLTKAIARQYDIKYLQEAGIDLLQIYSQDELDKFKIKLDTSNAALYRLSDGHYEIFKEIPTSMKGSNIYVMGVEKDENNENMLTSVLKGDEFEEYQFDDDDQSVYTVYLKVNLSNDKLVQSKSFLDYDNEVQSLIQQIQENPVICDDSIVQDANCGILTLGNFINAGISIQNETFKTTQNIQQQVDLKGFHEFFNILKDKQPGNLQIQGSSPDIFYHQITYIVSQMRLELNQLQDNTTFDYIVNNQYLLMLLTGSFSQKLGYKHFLRSLFTAFLNDKFDTLQFIEDLIHLHNGIQQTLDTRLALATKKSYIQKSQHHSISSSYALWAGSQSLLQYQVDNNIESYNQIVDNIQYVFINPKDSETNKVNITAKNSINALAVKLNNQNKPEAVQNFTDHILGHYLHQDKPFDGITHPFLDYEEASFDLKAVYVYQFNNFKQQPQLSFKFDQNQDIPNYSSLNNLYKEIKYNQSLRIVQVNKKFMGVLPVSNILPDAKITSNKTEMLQKLQEYGYKVLQEESESEDNNDIQDIPKTYLPSMLEVQNGEVVEFDDNIDIIIPHIFIDLLNIKNLTDFKQQSADNLQKFGFDVKELALFLDLYEFGHNISPFLIFDSQIGYYYVPAYFNQLSNLFSVKSQLSQADITKILSTSLQQKFDQLQEEQIIQSNIMTLLDINQVYRKLAQAIREYKTQNFSCFNIMGRKIQSILDQNKYIEKFRSILNYPEGLIDLYYPTNQDKQIILQEKSEFNLYKNKNIADILQLKPTYIQDFYQQHENIYKFAAENLDILCDMLNFEQFDVLHVDFEVNSNNCYLKDDPQKQESKAFTDYHLSNSQSYNFQELQCQQIFKSVSDFPKTDLLILSRQRGYQISFLLRTGLLSPDDAKINVQKFYNYQSAQDIFLKYKCQNSISEEKNISLQKITENFMSAPLFKKYTLLEQTGKEPIYDIFGRMLRASAPYGSPQMPPNTPALLDTEAPPPPQAGGEESTVDEIIKFWTKFNNSFFSLDQNNIDSLLSPLFALEQRHVEIISQFGPVTSSCNQEDKMLNQQKTNTIQSCKCAETSFVFYPPSNNFMQLENFMRGIYYMSPYYLPKAQSAELERIQSFTKTCTYAVSVICQLLRDGLDRFCGLPSLQPQARPAPVCFTEIVNAYFIQQTMVGTFKHIFDQCTPLARELQGKQILKEYISKMNREIDFRQTRSKILDIVIHRSRQCQGDKIAISEVLKNADFWQDSYQLVDKVTELSPLIEIIIQAHPLLNILSYGEASDESAVQPLEIHRFLSLGHLGKQELEERRLEDQLLLKKEQTDEIYEELVKAQSDLKILEQVNYKLQTEAYHTLNQLKSIDLHDEFCDVYATLVNAKWSKCCYQDKKIHQQTKVSPDQMIAAGFETGGPDINKVTNWANGELSYLSDINALGYGDYVWENSNFEIKNIVEFD